VKTCAQCSVNYPDAVEFCPRDGSKLPFNPATQALFDPLIGSTIDGRYIVEALLGQGGMGYVYAGRHAIIDKRVAIKVLRKEPAADESAAQRFLVEAKAASKIGHQNIVDITDFGVLPDGKAYFVMEFLSGPTLGKLVHESGRLDALRAITITVQIARGLQAAHDKGIIHRDLKPENIFVLERDGQKDFIKIVDFGIAKDKEHKKKLTQAGMVLGTPEYMSPEQATGQPTDHRVDMYALGCILYEMLCGDVPYRGDTPTKTLTMHVFEKIVPPSQRAPDAKVPPQLEAVVLKVLSKKPNDRYQDMRELMGALEQVEREIRPKREPSGVVRTMPRTSSGPIRTSTPTPGSTAEALAAVEGGGKRRAGLYAAVAAAMLLAAGVGFAVTRRKPKETPPPPPIAAVAPPPAPAAPPPPAPAAEADDVELVLDTKPPGAEVFEGPEHLGTTPLHLRHPKVEASVTYVFRKLGFRDETLPVVPNRDKELMVELVVKDAPPHKVASRKSSAAPGRTAPPAATKEPAKRVTDLRNPFE